MMSRTLNAVLAIATSISLVGPALAAGQQSKGVPFIVLQDQIIEVENAVTDLDERVDMVVDDIIESIAFAVESVEQLIDVNQQAVASITDSITDLESQLSFLGTDPTALEATIAALQDDTEALEAQIVALGDADQVLAGQIATNNETIRALQLELGGLSDLRGRIEDNLQMILMLEATIVELQRDLELKQNRVNGTCPAGAFLVEITVEGGVICEEIVIPEPTPPGQLIVVRRSLNTGAGENILNPRISFLSCLAGEVAVSTGFADVNGNSTVTSSFLFDVTSSALNVFQPTAGTDEYSQTLSCARIQ